MTYYQTYFVHNIIENIRLIQKQICTKICYSGVLVLLRKHLLNFFSKIET